MARIRTIKPDFWRDDGLSKISAEAALLAIGLLNHSDDDGYFNANPKLIEADVFPLRELSGNTTVLLRELWSIGYVALFKGTDGKDYGQIVNFDKHQVINKKNKSKIKDLVGLPEDYGSTTVVLPHGMEKEGNGKERKGKDITCHASVTDSRFDEIKNVYPKRGGGQNWKDAEKRYNARIREGHTHEEILAGCERYASFIQITGKANTEFVKMASTFLGDNKSFLEPWTPPAEVKDVRQLSAVDRVRLACNTERGNYDERVVSEQSGSIFGSLDILMRDVRK